MQQEIRLHNIFEFGKELVEVSAIFPSHFNCVNLHGSDRGNSVQYSFRPILVTSEWLNRFGWIWNRECNSYENITDSDARLNLQQTDLGSWIMFNHVLKAKISNKFNYIHQLQNIYFYLTDKELKIEKS